jgi:hypothetical protein
MANGAGTGGGSLVPYGAMITWLARQLWARAGITTGTERFAQAWHEEFQQMVMEAFGHASEVHRRTADPRLLGIGDTEASDEDEEARALYDVAASVVLAGALTASTGRYRRLAECAKNAPQERWRSDRRRRLFVELVTRLDDEHFEVLAWYRSVTYRQGDYVQYKPYSEVRQGPPFPDVPPELRDQLRQDLRRAGRLHEAEPDFKIVEEYPDERRPRIEKKVRGHRFRLSPFGWDLAEFAGCAPTHQASGG